MTMLQKGSYMQVLILDFVKTLSLVIEDYDFFKPIMLSGNSLQIKLSCLKFCSSIYNDSLEL